MAHNEGRAEPLLVALAGDQLSSKQVLRNTPLESILILSFQAVGGLPNWQPRNLNIMLKALQHGARAAFNPKSTTAPFHSLLEDHTIRNR
jgi:hypothetical protein